MKIITTKESHKYGEIVHVSKDLPFIYKTVNIISFS